MTHELYIQICDYLQDIIEDTLFENHCFAVGGCVRDEILGHEIKDIDLCIDLPDGGIDFANWLYKEELLTYEPVVYPTYGTAMFQLTAFPDIELEVVQTRKEQFSSRAPGQKTCLSPILSGLEICQGDKSPEYGCGVPLR